MARLLLSDRHPNDSQGYQLWHSEGLILLTHDHNLLVAWALPPLLAMALLEHARQLRFPALNMVSMEDVLQTNLADQDPRCNAFIGVISDGQQSRTMVSSHLTTKGEMRIGRAYAMIRSESLPELRAAISTVDPVSGWSMLSGNIEQIIRRLPEIVLPGSKQIDRAHQRTGN